MAGSQFKYSIFPIYTYPEGFAEVLVGNDYWDDEPITIVSREGIYYFMAEWGWRKHDPQHPRCYYCGKFVKAGNWWKDIWTGPCRDCNDSLDLW